MRTDLQRPAATVRPLVGGVEAAEDPRSGPGAGDSDRDEAILMELRRKLKGRNAAPENPASANAPHGSSLSEEDKYEPQRLGRKICWQYDSNAKRVPLLRRHYI